MPSAVSVFTALKAHELLEAVCITHLQSKVSSETKLTRLCEKMFHPHWTFLAISCKSSVTTHLCSEIPSNFQSKGVKMQKNPYALLVESMSSFPHHLSAAYVFGSYHAALFPCGIAPPRAVSATRLTPDTSLHTVCCMITREGSTFPKLNVFIRYEEHWLALSCDCSRRSSHSHSGWIPGCLHSCNPCSSLQILDRLLSAVVCLRYRPNGKAPLSQDHHL